MRNAYSDDEYGYFGPESETWNIYREPFFLLGSVRALLLQVAHPAVAEGVAKFSNFEQNALGRGKRTFEAMTLLYFGDKRQASFSARKMNEMHRRIQGTYQRPLDGELISLPYSGNDPHLKLWILATLIDTSLLVYEKVMGPLTEECKNRFYEESKTAAALLEIPMELYPEDYESFQVYFQQMVSSGELYVGESGRKICRAILEYKLAPKKLSRLLAIGFLPPHLVEAFGVPTKRMDDALFNTLLRSARKFFTLLPPKIRWCPAYHQALRRVKLANQMKPGWIENWYGWLERFGNIPLGIPQK